MSIPEKSDSSYTNSTNSSHKPYFKDDRSVAYESQRSTSSSDSEANVKAHEAAKPLRASKPPKDTPKLSDQKAAAINLQPLAKKYEKIFAKMVKKKEFAGLDPSEAKRLYQSAIQNSGKVKSVVAKAFAKTALRVQRPGKQRADAAEVKVRKNLFKSHKYTGLIEKDNISLSKTKLLGEGTFGVVSRTEFSGGTQAFKLAKRNDQAEIDVTNEFVLLQKLNPDGQQEGIQEAPRAIISVATSTGEMRVGFLGALYDGTGSQLQLSGQRALKGMHQVFKGLQHLKNNNIAHGDIKPANMLMRNNGETLHLADFGGASTIYLKMSMPPFTDYYLCRKDIEAYNKVKRDEKELAKLYHAKDTFAACLSIYQMILGEYLQAFQVDPKVSPESLREFLEDQSIPSEIIDLLERGLSEDYTKRPSPEEFIEGLEKHIQS